MSGRRPWENEMKTARITAIALASAAAGLLSDAAQAQVVNACVNRNTGDVRINATGGACAPNAYPLQWNQPQMPPTPATPELHTQIIWGGPVPGTWAARAYCPQGWKVLGGGGLSRTPFIPLYASVPIATTDGVIAADDTAIGWQVTASAESEAQVHVVCGKVY